MNETHLEIDPQRSVHVMQVETTGGVVLTVEDPHTVAIVEMSREQADELMSALLPGELRECEHKWRDQGEEIGVVCRDCGTPAPEEVAQSIRA